MFVDFGTGDLDFEGCDLRSGGNFEPGIARQLNWIHRVCDYGAADSQVIRGDCVGDAIPCVVDGLGDDAGGADGFFDGIDAQVHCSDLTSQLACDGCLTDPG